MKPFQLLLVMVLSVAIASSFVQGATTASEQAIGTADCFNQKLSGFLDQLIYYCNYVCTANLVYGQALPAAYDPFGSQWAFPVMTSVEPSFYELYYGRPDNGFSAVSRDGTGSTSTGFIGYFQESNGSYRLGYPLNSTGELVLSAQPQNVSYAPTQRVWYTGAVASSTGIYVTSTPYVFSSTSTLGLSVGQKCTRNGALEIVSSTAALLNVMTEQYLTQSVCSQFDSANGAVVYVVNDQDILVLESDVILSSLITANESTNAAVRAAAQFSSQQGFDVKTIGQGTFSYNGDTWEIYSTPVSSAQWNWALVLIRPATSTCSGASSISPSNSLLFSLF